MTQDSINFDRWFSKVKAIFASRNSGGLAETEDWHEFYEEGLTPEAAAEQYFEQNT